MRTWVSRIDRTYARYLAKQDCPMCGGSGEIVVSKNIALDIYDLGPCECVKRKLRPLSPDAGIEELRQAIPKKLRKTG